MTAEARGSFRTSPWPGATAATAVPAAAEATATTGGGSPFVLPPVAPAGRHADPAPRDRPAPARNTAGRELVPAPRERQRRLPADGLAPVPDVLPDVDRRGHQPLPRRELRRTRTSSSTASPAARCRPSTRTRPASPAPARSAGTSRTRPTSRSGNASKLPQPKGAGRVTFLTLTDHFSQRAAPPPNGKEIYPAFFDSADVIGFDTYPVEVRCSVAQIDNVYWMQRELVALTRGKPTFQWIEAGPMEHCRENEDPTPDGRARRDLARHRRRRTRHRLLPRLVGGDHPQRGAPREPRDPRARPRAPRARRQGELVDREPGPHRRAPLQRRDLRHRGQHVDGADDRVVHAARASAAARSTSSATAASSSRSATSSRTSCPGSASRSTSSRRPAGSSEKARPHRRALSSHHPAVTTSAAAGRCTGRSHCCRSRPSQ